jgi:hypothetical protein
MRKPRRVLIQTARPTDDGDPSAVEEGFYIVEKGEAVLVIDGVPSDKHRRRLETGADADVVVRRLLRDRWLSRPRSDFNRRLIYPA